MHVIVIGGGPAGLVAATAIAKSGIDTTLVERAPSRVRPCAGLVSSRCLQDLDLPGTVVGERPGELALTSPAGRTTYVPLTVGTDTVFTICPAELQATLRQRAEAAGVKLVAGRFTRFRHGVGDYPLVEVWPTGAAAPSVLACDVVVGADGVGSAVARALGLALPPMGVVYQERLQLPAPAPEGLALHLGRKVSADLFGWSLSEGPLLRVGVTTGRRYGRRVWDMLAELKRRMGPTVAGAKSLGKEAFCYPLAPQPRLQHDRVLLVGDAAGLVPPVTRDGLWLACRAARLAAETIARHRHVPTPENLADYDRRFWAEHRALFEGQARLMTMFMRQDRGREALLDLARERDFQRAAVTGLIAGAPLRAPGVLGLRLRLMALYARLKYRLIDPQRLEVEGLTRSLPRPEDYLEAVVQQAPLVAPAEPQR